MAWQVVAAAVLGAIAGASGAPVVRRYRPAGALSARQVAGMSAAAALGCALVAVPGWSADSPAWALLVVVGTWLAAVDLCVHRLPDALVLPLAAAAAVLLGIAAAADGDPSRWARALAAAAVLFAAYLGLALLSLTGMGMGDVKLAAAIGLYLGWVGWEAVLVGTLAAFVMGALLGVGLAVAARTGRRTPVPFGPAMVAGAVMVGLAPAWGG